MNIDIRLTKVARLFVSIILYIQMFLDRAVENILDYIHSERRSIGSVVFSMALRVFLAGKTNRTEKTTLRMIDRAGRKNEDYRVPQLFKLWYGFDTDYYMESELCCFGAQESAHVVFYISGGVFLFQPTLFHYRYCKKLAEKLDARVIMPIYPKAPNHTHTETLDYLYDLYNKIAYDHLDAGITIMGDSSGGSLALTLSQYVIERGAKKPKDIIAISPCLDMTLTNPEIPAFKKLELMLNASDILIKFRTYFGADFANKSYLVSPLYCDYSILPSVTIVAGSREIFLPDIRLLSSALEAQGIPIHYYEYDKMDHAFALMPISEAKNVLTRIKTSITA